MKLLRASIAVLALFLWDRAAHAQGCSALIKGPVVLDIAQCKLLQPEANFDTKKDKYRFIADLDPEGRRLFYDSYRGMILRGKVIRSNARQVGLATGHSALMGQEIFAFVAPAQLSGLTCAQLNAKRVEATINEACCNGTGDAPCLLGTSYDLAGVKAIGAAGSSAGNSQRTKSESSAKVQAGNGAFRAKKYKQAIADYEAAQQAGELDMQGYYNLGYAYRELDNCRLAVPPLKYVFDQNNAGKVWADQEVLVRKNNFLLARCYAKNNDPANAVFIVNGYLLEPQRYASELRLALRHKDFGWIHTSKEYREFKAEAEKRLRTVK